MAKLTYMQVRNRPGSNIKVRCKETHSVSYVPVLGGIKTVTYTMGEVFPRYKVKNMKDRMWELVDP